VEDNSKQEKVICVKVAKRRSCSSCCSCCTCPDLRKGLRRKIKEARSDREEQLSGASAAQDPGFPGGLGPPEPGSGGRLRSCGAVMPQVGARGRLRAAEGRWRPVVARATGGHWDLRAGVRRGKIVVLITGSEGLGFGLCLSGVLVRTTSVVTESEGWPRTESPGSLRRRRGGVRRNGWFTCGEGLYLRCYRRN
jgi:hypothetical protein